MTETAARRWAHAAAAAGMIGNGLLAAFYVSFAMQDFGDPRGVAASLGSAADYAGIAQNLLLVAVTAAVYRFFSRQQWFDRVLQVVGAAAFASAAVSGVATVTGLTPRHRPPPRSAPSWSRRHGCLPSGAVVAGFGSEWPRPAS